MTGQIRLIRWEKQQVSSCKRQVCRRLGGPSVSCFVPFYIHACSQAEACGLKESLALYWQRYAWIRLALLARLLSFIPRLPTRQRQEKSFSLPVAAASYCWVSPPPLPLQLSYSPPPSFPHFSWSISLSLLLSLLIEGDFYTTKPHKHTHLTQKL